MRVGPAIVYDLHSEIDYLLDLFFDETKRGQAPYRLFVRSASGVG